MSLEVHHAARGVPEKGGRAGADDLTSVIDGSGIAAGGARQHAQVGETAGEAVWRIGRPQERALLAADHLADVVDGRRIIGAQGGHAVGGVPQKGAGIAPAQGIGIRHIARHLAGLIDATGITINAREAHRRAKVGHTVGRVPEEGAVGGLARHLAGIVDVVSLGNCASIQRSQIHHEIVAPVQVAVLEPHAPLRVDEKGVFVPIIREK